MRGILVGIVGVALLSLGMGCMSAGAKKAEETPKLTPEQAQSASRLMEFQRMAIVCAPAPGAEAAYSAAILNQAYQGVPSRLGFLRTVDRQEDAVVDTSVMPPKVNLGGKASNYNGVICLVYSYGENLVTLEIYVMRAATGEMVWHNTLCTKDRNVPARLLRHAVWAPIILRGKFYGAK